MVIWEERLTSILCVGFDDGFCIFRRRGVRLGFTVLRSFGLRMGTDTFSAGSTGVDFAGKLGLVTLPFRRCITAALTGTRIFDSRLCKTAKVV